MRFAGATLGLTLGLLLTNSLPARAGTLQPLVNQPPVSVGQPFLLTDGRVMFQTNDGADWYALAPDASGSYLDGTWQQLASLPAAWSYGPYAFASAVLADGRLLIEGGEYNLDGPFSLTNLGAIYDPVADRWTQLAAPPGWDFIGDSASIVMPNGKFLLGDKLSMRIAELDPVTLVWTELGSAGKADFNAEEGWTLLPDGSFLTVDVKNAPHAERYFYTDAAGAGEWRSAGSTPQSLAWNFHDAPVPYAGGSYLPPGETGPCILRPDASVFCTGSSDDKPTHIAHSAIYSLADGGWSAGPDFPPGDDGGDTSAVLLPSGNVLVAATSGTLYEFDGARLIGEANSVSSSGSLLLTLPGGQVVVSADQVQLYTPGVGTPDPSWAPTVSAWPPVVAAGGTYAIAGTQFNGLSQAQAFGDETQAPTNYPLVRLVNNASGHVFYAHTHDHSTMGVATGGTIVSTHFDVPADAETGAATLTVVANGIASAPVNIAVAATSVNLDQRGLTGSWYNPATGGQGLEIETYPDLYGLDQGLLFAGWFTYDTTASGGRRWYALSGNVDGAHPTATLGIYADDGGNLNAPPALGDGPILGHATLQFSDCNTAALTYVFSDGSGRAGTVPLTRLTPNATCGTSGDNGAAASEYLLSGNWFDPATSGQGFMFDISPSINNLFAAWYTFKPNGAQIGGGASQDWYTIESNRFAPGMTSLENIPIYENSGGVFDRPPATESVPVGTAGVTFHSCTAMTVSYTFTGGEDKGLHGSIQLTRPGPAPAGCSL